MTRAAHEIVELARSKDRLTALDYFDGIFSEFEEFHGDRLFGEDEAVVGGIACLDGKPVTVIGIQKAVICLKIYAETLARHILKVIAKRYA